MDVQLERRLGGDRRKFPLLYCRYGNERRENTENRRIEMSLDEQPNSRRVIRRGYWGASEDDSAGE